MAVKTSCPRCGKRFSAPSDYVGRKVECPRCGNRNILRTPEEERELAEKERELERREAEDRRRIDLIERQERRRQLLENAQPYYERYQVRSERVRHYNPRAPSRYIRLRSLSDFMVLVAYVVGLLSLCGAGLTVYLHVAGWMESLPLVFVCLAAWGLVGTTLFCAFKYLAELASIVADVGDHQDDIVQLLLDVRDNTDPRGAE